MSNMAAKLIVVCLVQLLVCFGGFLSEDIAMINGIGTLYLNGTSWKMARKSCKDKGTKLYTVDTVQEWYDLTSQLNYSRFNSFWVGARGFIENWVWTNDGTKLEPDPIGCFAGGYQLPNSFTSNQPTLCMSFCRHYQKKNFAALKGEQCHCYINTSHFRLLSKEDCNFTCPGNGDKNCGGQESVTVFSAAGLYVRSTAKVIYGREKLRKKEKPESINWSSEEPVAIGENKDCAMMVRNRDNHTMWYSGDCQDKNAYICKIETSDVCKILESEAPCFIQQKESVSWFEAARKCKQMGGHLAGKDIEGALHLNLGSQFYWTSLTRVSQRWTYGKDIDRSIPRSSRSPNTKKSCIAMQKIANDSWVISPEPCKRVMPYLCRYVSTQPSPPHNSIDFRNDDIDDEENQIEETYLLEGAHIFFIIIPSMFGILLTFSIVMLVLSLRRCKQREKKKIEQKQHFYFVLEKEESIYNTIDCVDINREPAGGSTNNIIKCTKASRVGSIDHDNTYNKLILKGRMANGWLNSDHVVRIDDTSRMPESQYDHVRLGERYDTIENVRKHCIILAENPYDHCDVTSNQCNVTSHKTFHIVGQLVPKEPGNVKTMEENIYDTADCDGDQSHSRENLIKHH